MNIPGSLSPDRWPFQIELSFDSLPVDALLLDRLFPEELSKSEIKAACIPFTDVLFHLTEKFKQILEAAGSHFHLNIFDPDPHHSYVACCCLILNKYYNADIDFARPVFYEIPARNGIGKYYRVIYNTDFMEILPTVGSVQITDQDIRLLTDNYDDLELWKKLFPHQSWILKGFAIMTMVDVTVEMATSIFKEKLLSLRSDNFKDSVAQIFSSILNQADIEVGFTLFDEATGRLKPAVFGKQILSTLIPPGTNSVDINKLCQTTYNQLITKGKYFALSDLAKFYEEHPDSYVARIFLASDIQSCILLPVIKDQKLLGVLEILSHQKDVLNSLKVQKLDTVMDFLASAIERLVTRFHIQADAVIQEHYTVIHPSVKWKFLHEAEIYLYMQGLDLHHRLSDIVLADVYPMFGQVDIKASTMTRNECIRTDLTAQLSVLMNIFGNNTSMQDEALLAKDLISELNESFKADSEQMIDFYLNKNFHPKLLSLAVGTTAKEFDIYWDATHKQNGAFYKHRRDYERTVELINTNLFQILSKNQLAGQDISPHYSEYFNTDGIEHIMYAGSSIDAHSSFNSYKLSALRLWQVKTICEMAISHNRLKANLPYPLEVTSLILAYHTPITLRFRMAEKRFDVDGTYNLRFEIIKKRIDKAFIKNTRERITQPGKLVIVYASDLEAQEYLNYILLLQEADILENDMEKLVIDDLQDITGLKALRISLKYK